MEDAVDPRLLSMGSSPFPLGRFSVSTLRVQAAQAKNAEINAPHYRVSTNDKDLVDTVP